VVLEIDHHGERLTVKVSTENGSSTVQVGDEEIACDWLLLPDGSYSLILNGQVFDLSVDLDTDACLITDRWGTHRLRVADPRSLARRHTVDECQAGLQRIAADMPGKVVRLLVKPGDSVDYDQGLLVLEAMKMQNEIRAPKRGVVKEIGVEAGQAVSTGDFLISLE